MNVRINNKSHFRVFIFKVWSERASRWLSTSLSCLSKVLKRKSLGWMEITVSMKPIRKIKVRGGSRMGRDEQQPDMSHFGVRPEGGVPD